MDVIDRKVLVAHSLRDVQRPTNLREVPEMCGSEYDASISSIS